jgi:hypothetical protein
MAPKLNPDKIGQSRLAPIPQQVGSASRDKKARDERRELKRFKLFEPITACLRTGEIYRLFWPVTAEKRRNFDSIRKSTHNTSELGSEGAFKSGIQQI